MSQNEDSNDQFENNEIPEYACIICGNQNSNVSFSCGHITYCENCAFLNSQCAICGKAGRRMRIIYDTNLRVLTLQFFGL